MTLRSHDIAQPGRLQGLLVLAGVREQFSPARSGAVLLRAKEADWPASGHQARGFQEGLWKALPCWAPKHCLIGSLRLW